MGRKKKIYKKEDIIEAPFFKGIFRKDFNRSLNKTKARNNDITGDKLRACFILHCHII